MTHNHRHSLVLALFLSTLIAAGIIFLLTQKKNSLSPTLPNPTAPQNTTTSSLTPSVLLAAATTARVSAAVAPTVSKPSSTVSVKKVSPSARFWKPSVNDRLHWLYESDLANQTKPYADIYNVDAFDVSAKTIATLHAQGKKVICYINVGALEDWRSDIGNFPEAVVGNDYEGWDGERWLDSSNVKVLGPLMKKRFEMAGQKGCDGIDADNMDGYAQDTGFEITAAQQIAYNRQLASLAHGLGLSIGQKNDPSQIATLKNYFDWAIVEDCAEQGWCADFRPYTASDKPVFQVEYTDTGVNFDSFCADAKKNRFSAQLKHRNLNAWVRQCP